MGCTGEQEAEAPSDVRRQRNRWRSHQWTRAEGLENKRSETTKVARRGEDGRQEIEAEAPVDKRRRRDKSRRRRASVMKR